MGYIADNLEIKVSIRKAIKNGWRKSSDLRLLMIESFILNSMLIIYWIKTSTILAVKLR